jgi:hypothetical protein
MAPVVATTARTFLDGDSKPPSWNAQVSGR